MIRNHVFDVIILGAGGGGCAAAIMASQTGASVAILSKESIGGGNTRLTGGMMTCPGVSDGDSAEILKEDMIRGGGYLNNIELVDTISNNATKAIQFIESLGQFFLRDEGGFLSSKSASSLGGHSFPRSFTSVAEGISISRALRHAVIGSSIAIFEDTFVFSLLTDNSKIQGALAVDLKTSDFLVFSAKTTVLATGGCGWLYYPQTTNIRFATGDGYALAYEAGAELVDMEMVQFFPFAMNHPAHFAGSILGEPRLAGPKGQLINGVGEVVLDGNINRMTRAQVTAVMAREITAGRTTKWGGLKLDLSGNLDVPDMVAYKKRMVKRFEKIRKAQGEAAYQWKEPWDVSPSAHYMMGGVKNDSIGRSTLLGLYVAGEVGGGSMGANRLGSTSLVDVFVIGMAAGNEAACCAKESVQRPIEDSMVIPEIKKIERLFSRRGKFPPIKLKRELQKLMLDKVGIARDEKSLTSAISEIDRLQEQANTELIVSSITRYNNELLDALELNKMLTCARMIATSAQMRRESRGAHFRLDYPETCDAHWLKNIRLRKEKERLAIFFSDISARDYYEKEKPE